MKLSVNDWEHVQNECFTDEEGSQAFRDDDHQFLCRMVARRLQRTRNRTSSIAIAMDRHFSDLVIEALKRSNSRFASEAQG
jgi:hypothetical protein